ncbi:hypothetical protein [Candidatus Bathycorpusculum sp.]|uniref:hypothetical protein n=1 Tax=Candidatus Bathycorpusculum sp. TaxID=2994959 RepID=UPI002833F8E1|nr:hypothetical protein [Candidatus Termitimicrobium sp.]
MSTELAKIRQCELSDKKDEQQIIADMQGMRHMLETWVYQFEQGGRTVTALSYAGIKEAIRRRGNFKIIERQIEETPLTYRAIIVIEDLQTNTQFMGCNEVDKKKPFAYVLALNKAERNAYAKAVPTELITTLVKMRLDAGDGIETIEPDPLPTPPKTKTVADYKLPPKKVEATPIPKVGDVTSQGTVTNIESTTYHDGSTITRVDCEIPPEQQPTTTSPQKIVPPLQVMINKEKAQQAKKADELRKDNKVSNTSFTHTIPDSTGKLVPVTEEEYLAYCQMNQTGPISDSIIWTATSGGNYEKAYEKQNKGNHEYEYLKDSLMEAKERGQKSLTVDGLTYFIDTFTGDGILRSIPKKGIQ